MTMRHLLTPLFLVLALALALPALAQASPDDVLSDCNEDESIDGKHSDKDKRAAIKRMPREMREYTDCEQIIAASINDGKTATASGSGGSGGGGAGGAGGGGSGGSFDPDTNGDGVVSDQEQAAADKRKRQLAQAATEDQLGERQSDSAPAAALDTDDTANGMSLPAVLALVALLLLALAGGAYVLWRRNPELLRRVPLPSVPSRFRRS
jgi:hypothetical protein